MPSASVSTAAPVKVFARHRPRHAKRKSWVRLSSIIIPASARRIAFPADNDIRWLLNRRGVPAARIGCKGHGCRYRHDVCEPAVYAEHSVGAEYMTVEAPHRQRQLRSMRKRL